MRMCLLRDGIVRESDSFVDLIRSVSKFHFNEKRQLFMEGLKDPVREYGEDWTLEELHKDGAKEVFKILKGWGWRLYTEHS